ncbi:hypothetical protein OCU04_011914 [Sclerotinia nivalis]|uniref:Uncharacterized protein n=1 Tax=Sclerotinia nivalis TaxID=352851 RepID=A0A9X0AAM8_9HELO|nr:hypothetical protein OCU04_011914 [Sclerotinia nivalis]
MGQESLIIGLVIIVITVIGGAVAFFVWHRLRRSRPGNGGIQMRPIRERGPDGRHVRERDTDNRRVRERGSEGRRVQDRGPGGLSLADILRDLPGRPVEGTEGNDGRSLADIVNPPAKRRGTSSAAHLKGKIRDTTEESQVNPSTAGAEVSSSDRVRKAPMHAEESVSGVCGKGKGKPAPGKIQRRAVTPDNSSIPLIRVESSPSCSQDESSLKSAP